MGSRTFTTRIEPECQSSTSSVSMQRFTSATTHHSTPTSRALRALIQNGCEHRHQHRRSDATPQKQSFNRVQLPGKSRRSSFLLTCPGARVALCVRRCQYRRLPCPVLSRSNGPSLCCVRENRLPFCSQEKLCMEKGFEWQPKLRPRPEQNCSRLIRSLGLNAALEFLTSIVSRTS